MQMESHLFWVVYIASVHFVNNKFVFDTECRAHVKSSGFGD